MGERQKELYEACFSVAQATHWQSRPISADAIQKYAGELYKEALIQVESAESLGGSIEVVTRAVRYIEQAHAIPPVGNDVSWFSTVLQTLMEVVYPNTQLKGQAAEFLFDMENGILSVFKRKIHEEA